jgi:hypothetical protein
MDLHKCIKFVSCNASLCPLGWTDGKSGWHGPGEQVCPLALEIVKDGGPERVKSAHPLEVVEEIEKVLPEIRVKFPEIDKRLHKAAQTGSRIDQARAKFAKKAVHTREESAKPS